MVDLNGHEAGNGGYSQGTPTAHRALFYSDIDGNAVNRDLSCKGGSFAHSYFLTLACVAGGGRGLNRGLSPEAILVNLE